MRTSQEQQCNSEFDDLQMPIIILVCVVLNGLVFAQQYPSCPGGMPTDSGNTTNTNKQTLLGLTSFMNYEDNGDLLRAFTKYAQTGSRSEVDSLMQSNQRLYIIITVLMSSLSLVLLFVMIKIGNLHLSKKEVFEKMKEKGFTSPISAFYILVAVVLLVSATVNAYEIVEMIETLNMTECRLDELNNAFLNGAVGYNWGGINAFADKLNVLANLSSNLEMEQRQVNFTEGAQPLAYAQNNYNILMNKYSGVVNSYSEAVIGYKNHTIQLVDLVPNLFANATLDTTPILITPLLNYFSLINRTISQLYALETNLNNSVLILNDTAQVLTKVSDSLRSYGADFHQDFVSFRLQTQNFYNFGHYILIICEIVTALTIFGSLVSIFSLKLIQCNYDYFSLSVYKIIWATHIIVFCMNMVFLLVFNQILVYNTGVCSLADQVIGNRTMMETVFPKSVGNSGLFYLFSSIFANDLIHIAQIGNLVNPLLSLVSIKQSLSLQFAPTNFGVYDPIFESIKESLWSYELGLEGNFEAMNAQLDVINNITDSNYKTEGCYKHHWQYSPNGCLSNEPGIVKPTSIVFLNNTLNYSSQQSVCYILSDYTSNSPTVINKTNFFSLYGLYNGKCPLSNGAVAASGQFFFEMFSSRVNVFTGLIGEIYKLAGDIQNVTSNLVIYINNRSQLLQNAFDIVSGASYANLTSGSDMSIVRALIKGIYNQFCINFRGDTHQVYFLVLCNVVYIILMISFSLLYAIALRSTGAKDLDQSYENVQFMQTGQGMSSDSSDNLSASESESKKSEGKSQEG